MCEQCEWVHEVGKVLNEYLDYTHGAKEHLYFRKVFAWPPIDNFINSGRVCNVAFQSADMAYNSDLLHTSYQRWSHHNTSSAEQYS